MEENLKQQPTSIIKIALLGPESTGKTTLATQLAEHFQTVWAPEFARNYLQQKWDDKQEICQPEDLLTIAEGQTKTENDALLTANKYLFCDTNLMVTKIFSEIYYHSCDPILDKAARKHKYDLFFLTDVDVPWEKDDLRDRPFDRRLSFDIFQAALIENGKPYIILTGTAQERLEKAVSLLEAFELAKELGFNSHDFVQICGHGVPMENIKNQLFIFKKGIAKTALDRAAVKGDGILRLSEEDFQEYAAIFDAQKHRLKLKKFVPASGAASRMFKFLSEFINEFDIAEETINAYINRKNVTALSVFLAGMEKFPFYEEIDLELRKMYSNFRSWNKDLRDFHFIKMLLSSRHFDFGNKPKGVLPFHKYDTHIAAPVEEHLNEGVFYACSNEVSNIHFTVSKEHQAGFEAIIDRVRAKVEASSGARININYSYQDKATDTIAVDMNHEPFRTDSGQLVFRPGGHGALIQNLDRLCADVVFIKNIDNVIQNHIQAITLYKKALAGILVTLQRQVFQYLEAIDGGKITGEHIAELVSFATQKLNIEVIEDFAKYTLEHKIAYLAEKFNRPIRVCGMVKNEGEPGGGPFWVRDLKGHVSLQIVETSQIDLSNESQLNILKTATHFNPVDLVCGIKNYRGEKFDLTQFIDHSSGFIVEKNKNGRDLKAYELPGLWNGAMAKWITIFVQVPLITFNPVKTVNDLLKTAHQPQ